MENYAKLWLGYTEKKNNRECKCLKKIVLSGAAESDTIVKNTVLELKSGIKAMLGFEPEIIVSADNIISSMDLSSGKDILDAEEYSVQIEDDGLFIESKSASGILYGAFDVLRTIACEKNVEKTYSSVKTVRPSNPLRMLNHWDNMDGSIERGYSGRSFFYKNDEIIIDERTKDYARLIASVGINAV